MFENFGRLNVMMYQDNCPNLTMIRDNHKNIYPMIKKLNAAYSSTKSPNIQLENYSISRSRKRETGLMLDDLSRSPQAFNRPTEQEGDAPQRKPEAFG